MKYKIITLTLILLPLATISAKDVTPKNNASVPNKIVVGKSNNNQELTFKMAVVHEEKNGKSAKSEKGSYVDFQYPQIEGLQDELAQQTINNKIKTIVEAQIKKLLHSYKEIKGTSTVILYTPDLLSIRMDIVCDLRPYHMAHPVNYLLTLNYDLKNKKEIKLNDLFVKSPKEYLPPIAKIAEENIIDQFKKEDILSENEPDENEDVMLAWIKKGVEPKANNYQNFLITKEGIIFIFNYYQLGPRYVGEPQATIPFAAILDLLNYHSCLKSLLPPPKEPTLDTKNIKFDSATIHEEAKKKSYIDFKYPIMIGASDQAMQDAINNQIKTAVTAWVNNYKNDNQIATDDFTTTITNNLLSIKFVVNLDQATWPPSNNPIYKILTLNYDLNTKKEIHLADIFKPSSNYLQVLSAAALADLKEQLKNNSDLINISEDKIKEMTAPKPENYQNFLFNAKGITFIFENDKMALHKANYPKVLILYGKIEDLIDPKGPLA